MTEPTATRTRWETEPYRTGPRFSAQAWTGKAGIDRPRRLVIAYGRTRRSVLRQLNRALR